MKNSISPIPIINRLEPLPGITPSMLEIVVLPLWLREKAEDLGVFESDDWAKSLMSILSRDDLIFYQAWNMYSDSESNEYHKFTVADALMQFQTTCFSNITQSLEDDWKPFDEYMLKVTELERSMPPQLARFKLSYDCYENVTRRTPFKAECKTYGNTVVLSDVPVTEGSVPEDLGASEVLSVLTKYFDRRVVRDSLLYSMLHKGSAAF